MKTVLGNGSSLETKKNIISIKSKSFVHVHISDYINDVFYGKLASDKQPAHTGKYVLQKSEIWIAGTSDTTLDSRYFGPATLGQIEAHAYAVL